MTNLIHVNMFDGHSEFILNIDNVLYIEKFVGKVSKEGSRVHLINGISIELSQTVGTLAGHFQLPEAAIQQQ